MAGGKAQSLDFSSIGKGNVAQMMANINKKLGSGTIMKLGETRKLDVQWIPTGVAVLDAIFGGGFARGRIHEVYGPESSTKTTVALHAIAECQRNGGVAAFIDFENALDPVYASNLGVDVDNLLISQPDTAEQGLEAAVMMAESGLVDLIVLDSVAAMSPRAEVEGEMGDAMVGVVARLMSQAMRKLAGALGRSGGEDGKGGFNPPRTAFVAINQIREKVGVLFGNPETTPGGRALKFFASIRAEVRKQSEAKKDGEEQVANSINAKTVKNKLFPPFKKTSYFVYYGTGIDNVEGLMKIATEQLPNSRLTKRGANFYWDGQMVAKGKDALAAYFKANKEVYEQVNKQVTAFLTEKAAVIKPGETFAAVEEAEVSSDERAEAELDENQADDVVAPAPAAIGSNAGAPLALDFAMKGTGDGKGGNAPF